MLIATVPDKNCLVLLSHKLYVPVHKSSPSSMASVLAKFSIYLLNIRVRNFLEIICACVWRWVVLSYHRKKNTDLLFFWDVTSCKLVKSYRRFGTAICFHFHSQYSRCLWTVWIFVKNAVRSSIVSRIDVLLVVWGNRLVEVWNDVNRISIQPKTRVYYLLAIFAHQIDACIVQWTIFSAYFWRAHKMYRRSQFRFFDVRRALLLQGRWRNIGFCKGEFAEEPKNELLNCFFGHSPLYIRD